MAWTMAQFVNAQIRRALLASDKPDYIAAFVAEQRAPLEKTIGEYLKPADAEKFWECWERTELPKLRAQAGMAFDAIFSLQEMQIRDGIESTRHRSYSGMPYTVRVRVRRGSREGI